MIFFTENLHEAFLDGRWPASFGHPLVFANHRILLRGLGPSYKGMNRTRSDTLRGDQPGGIGVLSHSLLPKHLIGRICRAPIQPDLVGFYEIVKIMLDRNGGIR